MVKQWNADKFELIQTLEGHFGEVWAMDLSNTANFVISAASDFSIRMWEKTEEILVLQEEREIEREKAIENEIQFRDDEDVVPGEQTGEVALAATRTTLTVRSADDIVEAIDICKEYGAENAGQSTLHPLMQAYNCSSSENFMMEVLRRIRSSDLEKCLMLVPFGYVFEMLALLERALHSHCKTHVELAVRCILFILSFWIFALYGTESGSRPFPSCSLERDQLEAELCDRHEVVRANVGLTSCWDIMKGIAPLPSYKYVIQLSPDAVTCRCPHGIHSGQLTGYSKSMPLLARLNTLCKADMDSVRDKVGVNQAALRLMQKQLDETDKVSLFSEALDRKKSKKRSSSVLVQNELMRLSKCINLMDERLLSSSLIESRPAKPPNVLIYSEDDHRQTFQHHAERIAACLNPFKYTVYQLRYRQMEKDPWPENTCCLILLNTFRFEDSDWNRLYTYWKIGGKLLFISSQSLIQLLTRVSDGLMPYHLLSHIFCKRDRTTHLQPVLEALSASNQSVSQAELEFSRRVTLKNSLDVATVEASFVRNTVHSLLIEVKNLLTGGLVVFTESDFVSHDPPWITPVLDCMKKLDIEISDNKELSCTPGYLFIKEQIQLEERFVNLGRVRGKVEVEFFPERSTSKIGPPQPDYVPVYITPRTCSFNTEIYARHLTTAHLGRALLYVPVISSTMSLFDGLMTYDDIIQHLVAVAGRQTEGQGMLSVPK
ncbi:unnamed protein product [Soboliphyme baturini]|uniref:WD_REPEATS_REGION domain-containing protein n=1 Tax=Soboliphyme baturini TaxID=241478 RepID=A0A183IVY7_9BILA|nr:unnamed protein product [Soboliphyme baturini]